MKMGIQLSSLDEQYISRCLRLARCGRGSTSPNPMVGAVIVCDGRIIGEGYHIRAGEPHAEVNAVRSVKDCDKELLSGSTIYVSLEPCSHYGKTPPCCDLIISYRIPRVVIAATDINAQVNGAGIARMRAAGIEVVTGVLDVEAYELNKTFFTLHKKGRPYITLKWAETADGFIDKLRGSFSEGKPLAISTPESLVAMHRLRADCDAIMVGSRTALLDDPSLTVRHWGGRNPIRLVVDRDNSLPATLRIFDGTVPAIIYTYAPMNGKYGKNVEQIKLLKEGEILSQIIAHLADMKINNLLVEGGAALLNLFLDSGLWDAIRVERNPSLFIGNGVVAPQLPDGLSEVVECCGGNEIHLFAHKKS